VGGTGSGRRRGEGGSSPRQATDEVPALEVGNLKRKGVIVRGQERVGGGPRNLPWIGLEWTPCNFGGERPWFVCEECSGRVRILYGPTLPLLCRQCRGLSYASQLRGAAPKN
jgi:hypothetical protein